MQVTIADSATLALTRYAVGETSCIPRVMRHPAVLGWGLCRECRDVPTQISTTRCEREAR